ncbi:MAG: hypothetical protein IH856_23770 [Deltaproteobacteria bacterium]|nr:hypothetical protein [Deltaproteobacteria bacterium]
MKLSDFWLRTDRVGWYMADGKDWQSPGRGFVGVYWHNLETEDRLL